MKTSKKFLALLLVAAMVLGLFPAMALGTEQAPEADAVPLEATAPAAAAGTSITNLTVNYQINPVGIDRHNVRFGWQMESDRYAVYQRSYQIQLFRIVDGPAPNVQVWDSGLQTSSQAQGIILPASVQLNAQTRYQWHVTVVDNSGAQHTSANAWFLTGANWSNTEWIMPAKCSIANPTFRGAGNTWTVPNAAAARDALLDLWGYSPSNTMNNLNANPHGDYVRLGGNPLMRTLGYIPAGQGIAFAQLYMTALGDYIPFINGERVAMVDPMGRDFFPMFAPGFTDFNMFINYQTYDVTHMLTAGEEFVLGALVNKGAYAGRVGANYYGSLGRFAHRRGPDATMIFEDNTDPTSPDTARRGTGNMGGPLISPMTRYVPFTDNPSRTLGLRAKLVVTLTDGTQLEFGNLAGDWETIAGPAIFNDYFNGEFTCGVRAALLENWATVGDYRNPTASWYAAVGASTVNPTWVDANGNITAAAPQGRLCGHIGTADFDPIYDAPDAVGYTNTHSLPARRSLIPGGTPTVPSLTWISYPMEQLRPNNTAVARFAYEFDTHPVDAFMFRTDGRSIGTVRPIAIEVDAKAPIPGRPAFNHGQVRRHPVSVVGLDAGSNHDAALNIGNSGGEGNITIRHGERVIVEMGRVGAAYENRYNRGQNMVGVLELEMTAPAGVAVGVRHAELLNDGATNSNNPAGRGAAGTLYYDALRGDQNQASFYVTRAGRQTWRPLTTYNGFQFAEIFVDTPGAEITLHGVTGRVITSAHNRVSELNIEGSAQATPTFDAAGQVTTVAPTFASLVTQLYDNMIWGMMGNWITIPIDCPQRPERVGWAGDAQIFAQTAISTFDTIGLYENYMQIMNANVDRFGNYGQVMPGGWSGNNQNQGTHSGWSDAGIVIPWTMFLNTGDTYLIDSGWDQMHVYMQRVWGNGPGNNGTATWWVSGPGVVREIERINMFNSVEFYGDWLGFGAAHLLFMNAVYQIYSTRLMIEMAEATGRTDMVAFYQNQFDILRNHFLQDANINEVPIFMGAAGARGNNPLGRYRSGGGFIYSAEDAERFGMQEGDLMTFGPVRNNFITNLGDNAQTGLIWALRLGLYRDEAHRQHLINRLDEHVRNEGQSIRPQPENTLTVGFLGVNKLLPFMTDAGLQNTAFDLFLSYQMASWLYSVRQGATTMWERWNSFSFEQGFGPTNMNSFNHFAYGAVAEWMYQYLAGIRPEQNAGSDNVGFRHFTLQPMIDKMGRLDAVSLDLETPIGLISSAWTSNDGFLTTYRASVPANTSATLYLPTVFANEAEFLALNPQLAAAIAAGAVTWVGPTEWNGEPVTQFELMSGSFKFIAPAPNMHTITFTNETPQILVRMQIGNNPITTVPRILRVPMGETITFTVLPGQPGSLYSFEMWTYGVPDAVTYDDTVTITPTGDMDLRFRMRATYSRYTLTVHRGEVLNSATAPLPAALISINGAAPQTLAATPLVIPVTIFEGQEYVEVTLAAEVRNFVDFSFASWTGDYESTQATATIRVAGDMEVTANFNWNGFYSLASLVNNPGVTIVASGQANATTWAVANLAHGNITNITGRLGWSAPALGAQNPANPPWVTVNLGEAMEIHRVHLYPRMCSTASPGVPPNFPLHFTLEYAVGDLTFPTGVTNAGLTTQINVLDWQPVVGAVIGANGQRIEADASGRFEIAPEDVPYLRPLVVMFDGIVEARYVRITAHRINAPEAGTTAWHMQLVHFGVYEAADPVSVEITNAPAVLRRNTSVALGATVMPVAALQNVIWSSNNPAAATVSQDGVVTARVATGVVVITARTPCGQVVASVTIRLSM